MSRSLQVPPSLQAIETLSGDFRFINFPRSNHRSMGNDWSDWILKNNDAMDRKLKHAGNGSKDSLNEDSPYSENAVVAKGRPSTGDEDLETIRVLLPLTSSSHYVGRWGNTTPMSTKKVLRVKADSLLRANPDIME